MVHMIASEAVNTVPTSTGKKNAAAEQQLDDGNNPNPRQEEKIDMTTVPQTPDTHTLPAWADSSEDVGDLTIARSKTFTTGAAVGYINQQTGPSYNETEPFLLARVEDGTDVEGYVSEIRDIVGVLTDMLTAIGPAGDSMTVTRLASIARELDVSPANLLAFAIPNRTVEGVTTTSIGNDKHALVSTVDTGVWLEVCTATTPLASLTLTPDEAVRMARALLEHARRTETEAAL